MCFVLSPFMFQVYITVMDNNDNPPVFSQPTYEVTIFEDIQPETEVVQVVASDRDEHHHLTYSLQSSIDPSSMRLFRIHPTLGIIYTAQMLDREACAQHILTVIVSSDHSHAQCVMFRILWWRQVLIFDEGIFTFFASGPWFYLEFTLLSKSFFQTGESE